ncbi:hypothetical protein [Roseovarius rhodophyticola]|uniref:DUF2953 domain-containing protein n=1 Tax=Roseovarius rhodophyticola TaxID=3080827 RepID=A0ABZ2TEF1_9RHOB|nr:hypothetical protein [Roseovarius sp. W115]MDV2928271.1 hypothetical protein [Roseovarius sp. W115]
MSVAITVLLSFAPVLLSFFVLILFLPLHIELSVLKDPNWRIRATCRPLMGYGPLINLKSARPKTQDELPEVRKKPKPTLAKLERMAKAGAIFYIDVLNRVTFRHIELSAQFDMGDASETGQTFGQLAPLVYGCSAVPAGSIDIKPLFINRPFLSGHAEIGLSVVPASLVTPAIRFGWRIFGPKS